jgi:hypothetical protein
VTQDAVLIGGGLRQPDANIELLERIVDSIQVHAPGTPIGFVALPDGSLDAAARALSRKHDESNGSGRDSHALSLMKKSDDAFNARDVAAMKRTHHPDMTARSPNREGAAAIQSVMPRHGRRRGHDGFDGFRTNSRPVQPASAPG